MHHSVILWNSPSLHSGKSEIPVLFFRQCLTCLLKYCKKYCTGNTVPEVEYNLTGLPDLDMWPACSIS